MFSVYMPDRCGAFFHDVASARFFRSRGHQVLFVFLRRTPGSPLSGVYRGVPYKYYMNAEADLMQSDVWTTPHYPILGTVRKLNERFQKPLVITCHFAENVDGLEPYTQSGRWAEAVLYVSNTMKERVEAHTSLAACIRRRDVLYPVMLEHEIRLPEGTPRGQFITLINGNMLKGVDVFLRVADRLKTHMFLGVRPYYRPVQVHDTDNVHWDPYNDDVRVTLSKTRILMVPSLTESWSRVAFEAMLNGIPVLYTKPYESAKFPGGTTHAIQEWIGDDGIACDRDSLQDWMDAIQMLDDPETYEDWSRRAKAKAESLAMFENGSKYESILSSFVKENPSTFAAAAKQEPTPQQSIRPPQPVGLRVPQARFSGLIAGMPQSGQRR
jgi:glycosyltransferase involved in cell wall biosynthesis